MVIVRPNNPAQSVEADDALFADASTVWALALAMKQKAAVLDPFAFTMLCLHPLEPLLHWGLVSNRSPCEQLIISIF